MDKIYEFMSQNTFWIAVGILIILVYQVSGIIKHNIKKKYLLPYQQEEEIEDSDFYIEYYKKIQQVNIYRTVIYFGIFGMLLWHENIQAGSILAVATGALIVIFQSFLMSFVVYFLVMSDYKIGDTVKIGNDVQGEIISIKPLYTHISGKNETAEHNGKLYRIPNYQIRQSTIIKVDLSNDANIKTILTVVYERNKFECSLKELDNKLIKHLDNLMQVNTLESAKNYKSYIGHKYKINYEPNHDGNVNILIGYISNNNEVSEINKNILQFIESYKKST